EQFLAWLSQIRQLHVEITSQANAPPDAQVRGYHARRSREIVRRWAADLVAVDTRFSAAIQQASLPQAANSELERRFVEPLAADPEQLARCMTDETWQSIAGLPGHVVELDATSTSIIRSENPTAARAGALSITKAKIEDPLLRLVQNLQASIALDSVKNEYTLHRQVHDWVVRGDRPTGNLQQLTERFSPRLFLTPSSDPWLGLAPSNSYTALRGGGVVTASP